MFPLARYFPMPLGGLPDTPDALILFVHDKIDIPESLGYPVGGIRHVHFENGPRKKTPTVLLDKFH